MPSASSCLFCGEKEDLVAVPVDDAPAHLCAAHHAALGADADRTFTDRDELLSHPALDRRAGDDRRGQERRMFPRPEGRRLGLGRRASDPTL